MTPEFSASCGIRGRRESGNRERNICNTDGEDNFVVGVATGFFLGE